MKPIQNMKECLGKSNHNEFGVTDAVRNVYTWHLVTSEPKYGGKAKRKGSRRMFLEAIPCVFSGESCLCSRRRRRLLYYQSLSPPELLLAPTFTSSLTFPTRTTMSAGRSYYNSTRYMKITTIDK